MQGIDSAASDRMQVWRGIHVGSAAFIALKRRQRYTAVIGRAGVFLAVPRVRFVFSASVRDVQLGNGGPPGSYAGESGWRAVTRVLRSCGDGDEVDGR